MNQLTMEDAAELCITQAGHAMELARLSEEQSKAFWNLRTTVGDVVPAEPREKEIKKDILDNITSMATSFEAAATLLDVGPLPDQDAIELFVELLKPRLGEAMTVEIVLERARSIAAALQGRVLREPR